ncbi:MAG: cation diffusion facilitator family transporter [Patescibacteria group bacterium]
MKSVISSKRIIISSIVTDCLDIILNTIVALVTGSVVMVAEAIQGVANLICDSLLFVGVMKATRKADASHPFGYGKELYFWTLMAAIVMLVFTATISISIGWLQFVGNTVLTDLWLAYALLSIAVVSNGYSLFASFRKLSAKRGQRSMFQVIWDSPFVAAKVRFLLNSIGVGAAVIGLVSLALSGYLNSARFDGLGAMIIGVLIAGSAVFLIWGVQGLLVGKSAGGVLHRRINKIIEANEEVRSVLDLKTMLIGPEQILVNVAIHAKNNLNTDQLEKLVDTIEVQLQGQIPMITHVQVELERPDPDAKK